MHTRMSGTDGHRLADSATSCAPPKEMLMNRSSARRQSARNLANSPTLRDVGSAAPPISIEEVVRRVSSFPRLRYMGS